MSFAGSSWSRIKLRVLVSVPRCLSPSSYKQLENGTTALESVLPLACSVWPDPVQSTSFLLSCACYSSDEMHFWGFPNSTHPVGPLHVCGFFHHRQILFRTAYSGYHSCFTTPSSDKPGPPYHTKPHHHQVPLQLCAVVVLHTTMLRFLLQTLPKRVTSSDPRGSLARQHAAEEDLWAIHLAMRATGAPDSESR